jgi:hypothetical protein
LFYKVPEAVRGLMPNSKEQGLLEKAVLDQRTKLLVTCIRCGFKAVFINISHELFDNAKVTKAKLSLHQSLEAFTFVRRRGSLQFLDKWLTDGGEVSALRAGRPLSTRRYWYFFSVRGYGDTKVILRLEGCQLKIML